MIDELKLTGFIVCIGLVGRAAHLFLGNSPDSKKFSFADFYLIFLTGFAVSSLILFILAILGYLTAGSIAAVLLFFLAVLIVKRRVSPSYLLFCLVLGVSVLAFSKLYPPYETFLQADDASVYLATAGQIAKSGGLFYTDPLVLEMSQKERLNMFYNRFWPSDTTGREARFPGGVRLIDVSKGTVTFGFYHMFPVWLGTAILILGQHQFLLLLTFFYMLSLIAIFLLGRRFGGLLTGIALPLLFLCFYPEIYFLRMPTSEGLSQALFLSGLWVFVSGLREDGTMLHGRQLVVGMLWGSTFLCHVIAFFYGSLSLVLVFVTLRHLAENLSRWRVLFVCLVTCGFLALYQQLTVQEYLYIGTFFGNQDVTNVWAESLRRIGSFLLQQRWIGGLLLIALCALLVPLSSVLMSAAERKRGLRIIFYVLMIAVMVPPLFRRHFHWTDIFQHIGWLSLYTSPVVLGLLLIGAVLFLYLQSDSLPAWSAFLFLLIPLISLLILPLIVIQYQPWTIRRFVPVVFPLLFLFGVSGWRQALIRFGVRANGARASSPPATKVHAISLASKMPAFPFGNTIDFLFVIFVCAIAFVFITKSYDLLAQRLYKDVLAQTKTLDDHVPANALLLVADTYAGIHLETPLQYFLDRDVLLLPFDRQPYPGFKAIVDSYLKRQRRPLFAILDPSSLTALKSQRIFRVEIRTGFNISFVRIPHVNQDSFPDPPKNNSMNLDVYRISEKGAPPEKSGIRFDDQDVTFLNFYSQERGWRWTTGASEIADFTFHTEGKKTMLILSTVKGFPAGGGNPELIINGTTAATLLKSEAGEFHFQVDGKAIPEIHSLLIRSQTFVPVKSKTDRRNLGLSFVSVRFLRQ